MTPDCSQHHDWLLPREKAKAADLNRLVAGRCKACGAVEVRRRVEWVREFERIAEERESLRYVA
jgi:uncharacterized OB-fold protein